MGSEPRRLPMKVATNGASLPPGSAHRLGPSVDRLSTRVFSPIDSGMEIE